MIRLALALHGLLLAPALAWAEPPQDLGHTCLWKLTHGRDAEIVCDYAAWLTQQERADLKRLTRGMLQDLRCTVSVGIPRALVDAAVQSSDHVFQAPPQPVACAFSTRDGTLAITATFAPRVEIKGGRVVRATPGLADVQGVNSYLAWPVVQYVYFAPNIRREMRRMINAYLERSRPSLAHARCALELIETIRRAT